MKYLLSGKHWPVFFSLASMPVFAQTLPQEGENLPVSKFSAIKVQGAAAVTEDSRRYLHKSAAQVIKLPLDLQELPQSATVITRQRIDDQNLTSLGEVMDQSPGITRQQFGDDGAGYSFFLSRGFSINNYSIDGVSTTAAALQGLSGLSAMDTAIYDNITVVRGATGLLSGAGDPSASMMMQRKRPTRAFKAQVTAGAGTWDRYRSMVDVSGPLNAAGSLRARLVAAYDESKSWKEGYRGRRDIFYGVLEADLTTRTLLRLGVEHMDNRYTGSGMHAFNVADTEGNPIHRNRRDSATAAWAYSNQDRTMAFAHLDHEFNDDWKVSLALGRSWLDNEQLYGVAAPAPRPDGSGRLTAGFHQHSPMQDTADINLQGRFQALGRVHELMLGANYYELSRHDTGYRRQRIPIPNISKFDRHLPRPVLQSSGREHQRLRQLGVYAATRLRVSDDLALILGSRVTNWKDHLNAAKRAENGVFTPYLGLVFDINDNVSIYSSYTEIFNPQSYQDKHGQYLDPEKGKNYEVGLKTMLFDGKAAASVALFETKKDNLAIQDGVELTPAGRQAYIAASNTRSRGVELEVNGEIAEGWSLGAGYTHYRFRGADGQKIKADIPANQIKLFTTYRLPGAWHRLTVGGGVTWQSKIENASLSGIARLSNTQTSYSVVDLMARYQFNRNLDLAINVDNLFDRHYRLATSSHTYGAPRNIMANVRYRF